MFVSHRCLKYHVQERKYIYPERFNADLSNNWLNVQLLSLSLHGYPLLRCRISMTIILDVSAGIRILPYTFTFFTWFQNGSSGFDNAMRSRLKSNEEEEMNKLSFLNLNFSFSCCMSQMIDTSFSRNASNELLQLLLPILITLRKFYRDVSFNINNNKEIQNREVKERAFRSYLRTSRKYFVIKFLRAFPLDINIAIDPATHTAASVHSVGAAVAILIRIPNRNSYGLDRSIADRTHTPNAPLLSGPCVGLHIILSRSGSRADSLTIVYDGTWTTHMRLHISRLSCNECTGERSYAAAQRCSWPRRNVVADKKNCPGLIWITGRNSSRQPPRPWLLYYRENTSAWRMLAKLPQ